MAYVSYNVGTRGLFDTYILAQPKGSTHTLSVYIRQTTLAHVATITYVTNASYNYNIR